MMPPIDIAAATAACAASAALGLRAYMLKPKFQDWCSAPTAVWVSLLVLSVVAAISALSILRGGAHATAREALLLIALAVTACVMLFNLTRQAPPRA